MCLQNGYANFSFIIRICLTFLTPDLNNGTIEPNGFVSK